MCQMRCEVRGVLRGGEVRWSSPAPANPFVNGGVCCSVGGEDEQARHDFNVCPLPQLWAGEAAGRFHRPTRRVEEVGS